MTTRNKKTGSSKAAAASKTRKNQKTNTEALTTASFTDETVSAVEPANGRRKKAADVETTHRHATPSQIEGAFRSKMVRRKDGELSLSVTFARYVFQNMTETELTALHEAIAIFRMEKRNSEIAVLEARLRQLKGGSDVKA